MKFYIENLGCAKNQVDAEQIITSLKKKGWEYSAAEDSDIIIVNTCGFIKPAKEESINTTLALKNEYPDKKIIMAGCLAQRYGDTFAENFKEIDGIFGNRNPEAVSEAFDFFEKGGRVFFPENENRNLDKEFPEPAKRNDFLSFPGSTYVKIAEGCNNNCSYCAIPLIKGPLKSRKRDKVLNEIKILLDDGFFEINLIAQDLASYGKDTGRDELIPLLEDISVLKGDFWIRLLYMHPDRFDIRVADICRKDERIIPYFDIPFQHASEKILRKMGRTGNSSVYLDTIRNIREKLDNAVIRSTFLLGFPGETKKDLDILENFIREAEIDWAGFFIYSREEGTAAYNFSSPAGRYLSVKRAEKRKKDLEKLQNSVSEKRLARFTGKTIKVIVEEEVEGEDIFLCRGYMNAPDIDGLVVLHSGGRIFKPGQIIDCRIIKVNNIDLEASAL